MHGEEIIIEAYASSLGAKYAEIGAITREHYRGMGLRSHHSRVPDRSPGAARAHHADWSCDEDNPSSARVARKLGFRKEKAYEWLEYEQASDT